jgi:hypothetical protein
MNRISVAAMGVAVFLAGGAGGYVMRSYLLVAHHYGFHDSATPVEGGTSVAELAEARERIAALERELATRTAVVPTAAAVATPVGVAEMSPTPVAPANGEAAVAAAPTGVPERPGRIAWRISAIEKFVPLTEEQRARLTVKFEREAAGGEEATEAESLDTILGEESARFYREQVDAAFKRAREEEVDREVVWLGRQLALSPEQEQRVKGAFDEVEAALDSGALPESVNAATGAERVKAMIAENRRREELRAARLKEILSADQFTAYSRVRAESTSSDLEVFHGAE